MSDERTTTQIFNDDLVHYFGSGVAGRVFLEVGKELRRAQDKHPTPFNSAHEGYAVIDEEAIELRNEVYWGNPVDARKEAIQLAAMAVLFILDVSDRRPRAICERGIPAPKRETTMDENGNEYPA